MSWSEPVNVTSLNTSADEFAPVWNRFQEQLYFNSTISGYSKFYFVTPDLNFNFTDYKIVEGEINLPRNNQSYLTFETNDIAYLSSYRKYPERSYLNIFQTRKKKNSWLKPFDIDSLISPVYMGHPTVSSDGSTLIFATTLNSGFGDTDLWMAFKQDNGTWGSLIQIPSLKTPGNEITPYLASNDTLYFASDGQEGPGGYDLFMSVRKEGIWQIPYPLASLNTEFDESDFTTIPNGKAIFSSNRPGGIGGLDLYMTSSESKEQGISAVTSIDFSIAAQVPDVKTIEDVKQDYSPVFTYYFFDKTEILSDNFKFSNTLSSNNPDSIHLFSPNIIAKRIRNLKEHKLFIQIFSNVISQSEQDILSEKLINLLNLSAERVAIHFNNFNDRQKSVFDENTALIKFTTNNEKVFNPIDISEYKMELIPPALELSIDAKPRNIIKNWECKLAVGKSIGTLIKTGNDLPATFFHELKNFSKELSQSDSLEITLASVDTLNRNHEYKQVFNVSHSSSVQDRFILYKNKKYLVYYLILTDIRELREGFDYLSAFRLIAEKALEKKKILIRCYSDFGKGLAPGIKDFLSEQVGGSELKIDIDNEIIKDKYSKKPYGKFIFSILVEI